MLDNPTEPLRSSMIVVNGVAFPGESTQEADKNSDDANNDRVNNSGDRSSAETPNVIMVKADKPIDTNEILPAQGMTINEKGQIVLTAYPTPNVSPRIPDKLLNCRA